MRLKLELIMLSGEITAYMVFAAAAHVDELALLDHVRSSQCGVYVRSSQRGACSEEHSHLYACSSTAGPRYLSSAHQ